MLTLRRLLAALAAVGGVFVAEAEDGREECCCVEWWGADGSLTALTVAQRDFGCPSEGSPSEDNQLRARWPECSDTTLTCCEHLHRMNGVCNEPARSSDGGSVLCAGQADGDYYCDGARDCGGPFCSCAEAQNLCGTGPAVVATEGSSCPQSATVSWDVEDCSWEEQQGEGDGCAMGELGTVPMAGFLSIFVGLGVGVFSRGVFNHIEVGKTLDLHRRSGREADGRCVSRRAHTQRTDNGSTPIFYLELAFCAPNSSGSSSHVKVTKEVITSGSNYKKPTEGTFVKVNYDQTTSPPARRTPSPSGTCRTAEAVQFAARRCSVRSSVRCRLAPASYAHQGRPLRCFFPLAIVTAGFLRWCIHERHNKREKPDGEMVGCSEANLMSMHIETGQQQMGMYAAQMQQQMPPALGRMLGMQPQIVQAQQPDIMMQQMQMQWWCLRA